MPDDMEFETRMAEMDPSAMHSGQTLGKPSVFSCPECGGVLHELHDGAMVRFRCRVGHAFSAESVLAEQAEALETALWSALNTLEESASLSRRMIQQAEGRGQPWLANRFRERVQESEKHAEVLRQVLLTGRSGSDQISNGTAAHTAQLHLDGPGAEDGQGDGASP